jgi:hypothetical protein
LEDAAMLAENANAQLSTGQVDAMLRAVVERHLTKLERVALAANSAPGFEVDQARSDDKRALWTYTLLDAQGAAAVVAYCGRGDGTRRDASSTRRSNPPRRSTASGTSTD